MKNTSPALKAHHMPSTVLGALLVPVARLSFSSLFPKVSFFAHSRSSSNICHTELKCVQVKPVGAWKVDFFMLPYYALRI